MKILIVGLCGYMGRELYKLADSGYEGIALAGGVDPSFNASECSFDAPCFRSFSEVNIDFDCIIDFSNHKATHDMVAFAVDKKKPLVIATTGQTDDELDAIKKAAETIPVFFASNYSMGIALLVELAKKTVSTMKDADIEIVETHHNRKADAPSGTALTLAKEIADERKSIGLDSHIVCGREGMQKREADDISISSVRRGNIVGIHEILVSCANETITLKHEAHSRAVFAEGAIKAAIWLESKVPGLYNMKDMIK